MKRNAFSVVVPAYEEGETIESTVQRLENDFRALRDTYDVEIIVVDDGSRDGTAAALAKILSARPGSIRVITHERNRGLTQAIKSGCRAAAYESIVILDADLSYAPAIVEPLVRLLETSGAAAVLASPYMKGGHVANVPKDRLLYSRAANFLLSLCVGGRIKTFTGMVRAYDRATLLPILEREQHGEFNAWVVAELLRRGARIVELPAALVWPLHRTEKPSRMSALALGRRVRQVVETVITLLAAQRAAARLPTTSGP